MKKCNILKLVATIIAVVGAVALILYLFKDKLASCPLCKKFFGEEDEDDDDFFDDDFFEELDADDETAEAPEEETPEEAAEEESKIQVRRGYIPLKFQEDEV